MEERRQRSGPSMSTRILIFAPPTKPLSVRFWPLRGKRDIGLPECVLLLHAECVSFLADDRDLSQGARFSHEAP